MIAIARRAPDFSPEESTLPVGSALTPIREPDVAAARLRIGRPGDRDAGRPAAIDGTRSRREIRSNPLRTAGAIHYNPSPLLDPLSPALDLGSGWKPGASTDSDGGD